MESATATQKEVTFVTPVLFMPWMCDQMALFKKISYNKNDLLHQPNFPPQIATLGHCMVIDLPLENIGQFVNDNLYWLPLKSDAVLLQQMNANLTSISSSKRQTESLRHVGILETPLLQKADPQTLDRVKVGLKRLLSDRQTELEEVKEEFRQLHPLEQLITKKKVTGKREVKQLEKERQMMHLKHVEKLKPSQIAKKLRVDVNDVYRADKRLKVNYRKAKQVGEKLGTHQLEYFYDQSIPDAKRVEVKEAVANFVQTNGLKDLTRAKVIEGVKPLLPNLKLDPGDISKVLREDLHLCFLRYDSAMIRYQDPTFDCKRLWVSRILSQFLIDGALIISIDESHIRHDSQKQYQWQFYKKDHELRQVLRTKGGFQ